MNIQDQIKWENECVQRGSERYYANQDRLRNHGQVQQTDVVSKLLQTRLRDVARRIEEISNVTNATTFGKHNALLRSCVVDGDFLKLAYIGVQCAFQTLITNEKNTILKLCLNIAARLESELKCLLFEAKFPEYFGTVEKSFHNQNVTDFVHMNKVIMKKFNEFDIAWVDWDYFQKIHIGQKILQAVLEVFDDVLFINVERQYGKNLAKLDTTPAFDDWAAEFERERGFMFPMLLPLKVPPVAWDGTNSKAGGYYTPRMSQALEFIKTGGKDHRNYISGHDPVQHRQAVNKMQRTAWAINQDVLNVQKIIYEKGLGVGMPSNQVIKPPEFPEHISDIPKEELSERQLEELTDWKKLAKVAYGREKQRKGKVLAFIQTYKLAQELSSWDKFYYAYSCDFRGRIYCATTGLSPQGADTAKGVLRFAKGVVLGHDGIKWLAIHGANTFGADKVPYERRESWIRENEQAIRSIVEDPISTRSTWGNADKPYQFLAFCYEWARCDYGRNPNAESFIPIGLDGSCNGLQHYSALLRDEVGAKATNLTKTERPSDIYQEVADVCSKKLQAMDDPRARTWLKVGITRKVAKRPVMTLPYGAKQISCRQYILEFVLENWGKFNLDESYQWEMASFLAPILWESIGEVVIAARAGMSWLQKNMPRDFVRWLSPVNFPVYQYYKDLEMIPVRTKLNGGMRLYFCDLNQEKEPSRNQQRNGIAPNFVHSIDSSHMVMTINETDFPAYAMIHDDYGTHAGNTEQLFKAIRTSFYKLYTEHDPISDWAEQQGIPLDKLPPKGSYDIKDIFEAKYFFG
jgi:DNA-directed RNA polymerase